MACLDLCRRGNLTYKSITTFTACPCWELNDMLKLLLVLVFSRCFPDLISPVSLSFVSLLIFFFHPHITTDSIPHLVLKPTFTLLSSIQSSTFIFYLSLIWLIGGTTWPSLDHLNADLISGLLPPPQSFTVLPLLPISYPLLLSSVILSQSSRGARQSCSVQFTSPAHILPSHSHVQWKVFMSSPFSGLCRVVWGPFLSPDCLYWLLFVCCMTRVCYEISS